MLHLIFWLKLLKYSLNALDSQTQHSPMAEAGFVLIKIAFLKIKKKFLVTSPVLTEFDFENLGKFFQLKYIRKCFDLRFL